MAEIKKEIKAEEVKVAAKPAAKKAPAKKAAPKAAPKAKATSETTKNETTPKTKKVSTTEVKTAKATAKTVRITARKIRLVINQVRGKSIGDAVAILRNTNKRSSQPVEKLIISAAANAVNNHGMDQSKLFVKEIWANESITMKRFTPRAKGSASPILKRTSHIDVIVAER